MRRMPQRSRRSSRIRACEARSPCSMGEITSSIIDSFFDVHAELGFGFREDLYARALERLLIETGHKVDREVAVMVCFRGEPLAYERMDMVVDGKVIIENKAREPGSALCWPCGNQPRGRPRPSLWKEGALLPRILRESVQAP